MSSEVETMAHVGEMPWHKDSTPIKADCTSDEMLDASGLNWLLTPCPIFVEVNGKKIKIGNKQAWVRESDAKVMTLASPGWEPVQNKDMLNFFKEYCEAGGATLETAGSLRGGSIVWGLANLQDSFTVGGKKDKVDGYILFTSPHSVGSSIKVRTTTVRVVCANTLAMAEQEGSVNYKQNHMSTFNFDKAKEAVENAHDALKLAAKRANTLSKLKLSIQDSLEVLAPFFKVPKTIAATELQEYANSKPKSDFAGVIRSMLTGPGAITGNAWGTMNGVTHYLDHEVGRHAGARLWRSWMGDNGKTKLEVEAKLLEMAA